MYMYVHMQGDNLDSVTEDNFRVTVGGQECGTLSVQLGQMQVHNIYNTCIIYVH